MAGTWLEGGRAGQTGTMPAFSSVSRSYTACPEAGSTQSRGYWGGEEGIVTWPHGLPLKMETGGQYITLVLIGLSD